MKLIRLIITLIGVTGVLAAFVITPELVSQQVPKTADIFTRADQYALLTINRWTSFIFGVALLFLGALLPNIVNWSQHLHPIRKNFLRNIIFFLPLCVVSLTLFVELLIGTDNLVFQTIVLEDGPVEFTQSLVYFLSLLFAVSISAYFFKTKFRILGCLYLTLSIGFLFVCLEEISWGQRIFNLKTPEFFDTNLQDEISVHNLPFFRRILHQSYILVGLIGAFAWLIFPNKNNVNYNTFATFLVPGWFLMPYFLAVSASYTIREFDPHLENSSILFHQEVAELALSLGFLSFVLINFLSSQHHRK